MTHSASGLAREVVFIRLERMMRIELTSSAWKAEVLPLYHIRILFGSNFHCSQNRWSGRRDSNSRPSPWQGDALPLSHFRISNWWRRVDSNHCRRSQRIYSPPPLATRASLEVFNCGAGGGNRTPNLLITNQLLYQLSYASAFPYRGEILAIRTGLEPVTSSVTGWHSNQLNYRTVLVGVTGLEPVTPCL